MKKIITKNTYIKRLYFLFAFAALTQVLPAWNYLKVFRNDGEKPLELYSVDVDSLVCSKIGIDSIMYEDWQVQEIWTPDTIYRIPLTNIDSIHFKSVDTKEAVKNVVAVSKNISRYFVNSDNLQDLATHLGEIKDIGLVEDAWIHGNSLFVKVSDWGTISFSYPIPFVPEDNANAEDNVRSNVMKTREYDIFDAPNTHTPIYDYPSDFRICIVNQTFNDLNRTYEKTIANQMESNFKSCGYNNIVHVNGIDFGMEFVNNDLYNYDIILMATHGEYDGQRHWIYTGREYFVTDDINLENTWTEMEMYLLEDKLQAVNSPNCVSCGFVEELRKIHGETRKVLVCYAKVSELGFAKGKKKFRGNGTAILFNTACQSLENNEALPKVLSRKGLGYYLGYTHSNSIGWRACNEFTEFLLNGYDVIKSKKKLSPNNISERIDEYDRYGNVYKVTSNLIGVNRPDLSNNYTCIVRPLTLDVKSPFDGFLYGEIRLLDPTKTNYTFGFCTSKDKDMKSSTIHSGIKFEQCKYESSSHTVSFNFDLTNGNSFETDPTFFCAYVWDGENYCLGNIKEVEIKKGGCPDDNHPHAIDLGLPSGTKWSCCNVGASRPEGYGGLYAWGETKSKEVFTWKTYQYGSSSVNVVNIGSDISGTRYDAATAIWGAQWRMPTEEQIKELQNNCSKEWISLNGIEGAKLTGPNNNNIFIPAAGFRQNEINKTGVARCWASSVYKSQYQANFFEYYSWNKKGSGHTVRYEGMSVRPVYTH